MRRNSRVDPVTDELVEELQRRDGGCVAAKQGLSNRSCANQFGDETSIGLEVDHVRSRGLSLRGLSILSNTWLLCGRHHREKTESARSWRLAFDDYIVSLNLQVIR